MSDAVEPQFAEHLRVLWRVKWFALLAAAVAAGGVWAVRSQAGAQYQATSLVRLVLRNGADLVVDQNQANLLGQTYARLATVPNVLAVGVSAANLPLPMKTVVDRVSARQGLTPGFVEITARGPSAAQARALADGVAHALSAAVAAEQRNLAGFNVTATVEPATPSSTLDVTPKPLAEAAVAFVTVALLAAEALALARAARGALRLGDPETEVRDLLGVPCLAVDAGDHGQALLKLAPLVIGPLALEPVVTVVQRGRRPSSRGALLLAESAGAVGRRSALVDTDVSAPVFGTAPGLCDVVRGGFAPAVVARRSPSGLATVIGAGSSNGMAVTEVVGPELPTLLGAFGADVVVVSTTSAVPTIESLLVVSRFPGCVVLVVDPLRITKRVLRAAAAELRSVGQELRAVLLVSGVGRSRLGHPAGSFVPLVELPPARPVAALRGGRR